MNLEIVKAKAWAYLDILKGWLASPQFYAQVIAVIGLWLLAKLVARQVLAHVPLLRSVCR